MANFGPLTAEIGLPDWGTPANFKRFRVLPSLRQQHRPTKLCMIIGRLLGWYTIYTFLGGFCPWPV